jgi:hypothetical protein
MKDQKLAPFCVVWFGWVFAAALAVYVRPCVAAGELSLTVEEPSGVDRSQWPVTSGIPFARGVLPDDQQAALFDDSGNELPLQTESLARWPDGSVRWLLLDFPIDLSANQKRSLRLQYGSDVRRADVENPLELTLGDQGSVTIRTGPLRLDYDPNMFQPQGVAYLTSVAGDRADRKVTINCGSAGVSLRDEDNNGFRPLSPTGGAAEFTVEQSGPLRACLRVSGWNGGPDDTRLFRYVARIHAYRGQPWIRVFYTFINDCPDALMASVRKLEIRFYVRGRPDYCLLDGRTVDGARLFQVDESHYTIDDQPAGERARGWAAVGCLEDVGMAVGLREFWQNWPKGIRADRGLICLELLPEIPEGLYDGKSLEEENKLYYALRGGRYTFKVGVAKTHEFFVNYLDGKPQAENLAAFFQAANQPLIAAADPQYASASKALGEFPPADAEKFAGYDEWLDRALETHLRGRQRDREYGLLNYGDWYGERQVNWGNLEYDLAHGMFVQYLRTGDRRYFDRGEQAARHHIDVDVVHATNTHLKNPWGPPPQVGEIWLHCLNHTGGYYEDAPLPVSRTYQMGHSTNFGHVWVGGDFEYYFLTGDRRAREVAIEIADAMVRHCPTRYGDHIRALGWPIILVLNAYEATNEQKYLDAATACWQVLKENIDWQRGWVVRLAKGHCVHPERTCYGNVPFMEGLTISALARYHRITQDPEVLQAITVGIDQMIRECWVEEDKAFRYAACPLSTPRTYISVCLAAEAMAYESRLTGNRQHQRILREGLEEMIKRTGAGNGKSLAQLIHFTPYALGAMERQ